MLQICQKRSIILIFCCKSFCTFNNRNLLEFGKESSFHLLKKKTLHILLDAILPIIGKNEVLNLVLAQIGRRINKLTSCICKNHISTMWLEKKMVISGKKIKKNLQLAFFLILNNLQSFPYNFYIAKI